MQEEVPDPVVDQHVEPIVPDEQQTDKTLHEEAETKSPPDEPIETETTKQSEVETQKHQEQAKTSDKIVINTSDYRKFAVPAVIALVVVAGIAGSYWRQKKAPEGHVKPVPVREFLLKQVTPAAIKAEGDRRWKAGAHDDAALLLEEAARRGSGPADAELATLYDPTETLDASARLPPDARASAKYYSDAAKLGADVTQKRERLRASLAAKAAAGDTLARLTLKDFWP